MSITKIVASQVAKKGVSGIARSVKKPTASANIANHTPSVTKDSLNVSRASNQGSASTLQSIMNTPARMLDFLTGKSHVNISTHHTVTGTSPSIWADQFLKNPSKISPIATGIRHEGSTIIGKPFPGGPDIGIQLLSRQSIAGKTILNVKYSGAFEGPGRITISKLPGGKLNVHDEWLNVANKSMLPSLAAESGHPIVAGLGFKGIGDMATHGSTSVVGNVTKSMVTLPIKMMTMPFSFFR